MLRKMDGMLIGVKNRFMRSIEGLAKEERGASDIVAIMVVIVILLSVAVIFKTQLTQLVEAVFKKVIDWVNSI